MSKLPVVSSRQCVRVLLKIGFVIRRQTGSHIVLTRSKPRAQTVVPNHKTIKRGTLRSILRDADLTSVEFIDLL